MLHLFGWYLWEQLLKWLHHQRNCFCLILGYQHTNLAIRPTHHHVTGTEHFFRPR